MAKKDPDRAIHSGAGDPARLYRFVDIASFTEDWVDLKLGDDELRMLENVIARDPTRAPVIPGGSGVRKIRRPRPNSGKGKSGGYRVLYAFLPAYGTVLLIAAWPKSEREDLDPEDYRAIGKIVAGSRSSWIKGEFYEQRKLSPRGSRIVEALDQFADDLESGTPIESKYTVRTVRVIPEPSAYPPARVRAVRELIGASQEVFAQLLAVSPMTIRSWEQGCAGPLPSPAASSTKSPCPPATSAGASSPRILPRRTSRDEAVEEGFLVEKDYPPSTAGSIRELCLQRRLDVFIMPGRPQAFRDRHDEERGLEPAHLPWRRGGSRYWRNSVWVR